MAKIELVNKSGYSFIDVSSEQYREYEFETGKKYRIEEAQFLAVSDSGHRILDITGKSYFIPSGWIALTWKAKDGEPHFVK